MNNRTILTEVDGWGPLIDEITQGYGVIASAVFGRVWRYCQMESGLCTASQERIASDLKLSRATVNKHLEILVNAGYLEDLDPGVVNEPHRFRDTGKVAVKASIVVGHGGVKNFDTNPDEVSKPLTAGVKNFDTEVSKKSTRRYSLNTPINTQVPAAQGDEFDPFPIGEQPVPAVPAKGKAKQLEGLQKKQLAEALSLVTGMDYRLNEGRLLGEAKVYLKAGFTVEQIIADYAPISDDCPKGGLWYQSDWRGKRGDMPTLSQVRETWGKLAPINGSSGNGFTPTIGGRRPNDTLVESVPGARKIGGGYDI